MYKRFLALCCAILVTGAVILGMGLNLKYQLLKPLGLGQDINAMALPFVLMTDAGLRRSIDDAMAQLENPTESHPTQPSSEATLPTPEQTDPTQAPTGSTGDDLTEPTESTEASQPPVTPPPETQPPVTPQPTVPRPTIPAGEGVDLSWYDDALFIGNSRTVGLREYAKSSLGNADFFCDVGMSVFNYSSSKLESLLSSKKYGKILISLGINECGYSTSSIISAYKGLVQEIRGLQPDAVIILQGIMTVGEKKAASADYFKPSHLFDINERIAAMSDGISIFYIDVNLAFADERGYLPSSMSGDGVHLYAKCYVDWANWISQAVAQLGV